MECNFSGTLNYLSAILHQWQLMASCNLFIFVISMMNLYHIITGRNEVVAKVIFLHVSVIHSVHRGGGGLPQCMLEYHPPDHADPPPEQTPPPPPDKADHPRGPGRPPPPQARQTTPSPRADTTPLGQADHPPPRDQADPPGS